MDHAHTCVENPQLRIQEHLYRLGLSSPLRKTETPALSSSTNLIGIRFNYPKSLDFSIIIDCQDYREKHLLSTPIFFFQTSLTCLIPILS
ncbi:hypothetical protein PGT21_020216 [Puccinia graminis f. sp. tritici]|uniref:Uncharacterized protein n=1 Tax=Puccinia graminis f. sp. tritici TaxID=56615 RepID=A0A5B0QBC0_PUCGR|nr:hypothetical protein PGT21_020216 [Puccinia graminis f. sp. tritici]